MAIGKSGEAGFAGPDIVDRNRIFAGLAEHEKAQAIGGSRWVRDGGTARRGAAANPWMVMLSGNRW